MRFIRRGALKLILVDAAFGQNRKDLEVLDMAGMFIDADGQRRFLGSGNLVDSWGENFRPGRPFLRR